jgi:hypothetical protein
LAAKLGRPGEPGYQDAAVALMAAGARLQEFEARIPAIEGAARRLRAKVVCELAGGALVAEALAYAAASIAGVFSLAWLVMWIVLLFPAAGILITGWDAKERHPGLWVGLVLAAGAGAGAALAAEHVISGWFSPLAIVLGAGAFIAVQSAEGSEK